MPICYRPRGSNSRIDRKWRHEGDRLEGEKHRASQMTYNPILLGYMQDEDGREYALRIRLQEAERRFGRLPSEFNILRREADKGTEEGYSDFARRLHLPWGRQLIDWLEADKTRNLKGFVHDFYRVEWKAVRCWWSDFGVNIDPMTNILDSASVQAADASARQRRPELGVRSRKEFFEWILLVSGIPKSKLYSLLLEDEKATITLSVRLLERIEAIVLNSIRNKSMDADRKAELSRVSQSLRYIKAMVKIECAEQRNMEKLSKNAVAFVYADEVGEALLNLEEINVRALGGGFSPPSNIAIEYAQRDYSYFSLGAKFRDCTARSPRLQDALEVKNIFFTTQSWILDGNYSILKISFEGQLMLKFHICPLYVSVTESSARHKQKKYFFLHIDAIEATGKFRALTSDLDRQELIVQAGIDAVIGLADRMGIERVFAEQFSNTMSVTRYLEKCYREVYLDTTKITKIDDLEDVFRCAQRLFSTRICATSKTLLPLSLFMELQAYNTSLMSLQANVGAFKKFALIRGDADDDGYALAKVFRV